MSEEDNNGGINRPTVGGADRFDDEGGLRAPPELTGWRKAWWWFHFLILVKLARLRFIAILVVIGVIITQWDTLAAYYDKWTRPAQTSEAGGSDVEYFCPMHPSIIRDNPNEKCPICFMPLSKRKKGEQTTEALPAGVVNRVQLSPYRVVLAGVQTWTVDFVPLTKEITAVGYVEFNERGQRTVSARVSGRIDKLYANETGQMVKAGDDLALLYSPDLVVSVDSLLQAKRRGEKDFIESARVRLQRLGIDDAQLDEIMATGKATTDLRIRSPISGHVITKYVKEGQYVQEGTPLYDVADLSTVWIQAQVYEDDLAFLTNESAHGTPNPDSPGLEVTATTRAFPNEPFHGKLAFIYPHVDQDSRTVTVRCEVDNPDHKLRPGSTATITIQVAPQSLPMLTGSVSGNATGEEMLKQGKVLAVPESSVIDTGKQRIVYRETVPGVYEGVEVKLGPRMAGPGGAVFYPVLSGLEQSEKLVTSGSFLVDAETRLNPAAGSIYFGGSSGSKSASSSVTNVRPSTPDDPDAKMQASLARFSVEDRALVQAQKFCPVLSDSVLGSMGPPVKVLVDGQPVFLCCNNCQKKALDNPQETLAKVKALKEKNAVQAESVPTVVPPVPKEEGSMNSATQPNEEIEIKSNLEKLSAADRSLAEQQRVCPITGSRLGSMGAPIKVLVEGQPVFLCCDGCKDEALKNPKATLAKVADIKRASSTEKQK
jgi:membrane fusion protein, copper/silver efflux system